MSLLSCCLHWTDIGGRLQICTAPPSVLSDFLGRLVTSGLRVFDKDLPERGSDLISLSCRTLPANDVAPKWAVLPRGTGEAGMGQTVSTGELCALFPKPPGLPHYSFCCGQLAPPTIAGKSFLLFRVKLPTSPSASMTSSSFPWYPVSPFPSFCTRSEYVR